MNDHTGYSVQPWAMQRPSARRSDTCVVAFTAGQQRWWVPADQVREVHAVLSIQPVPQTADWFLGTALSRGRLVAVSNFSAWLGKACGLNSFIEFEQGYALGVESAQACTDPGSAQGIDPQQLLNTSAFRKIRDTGARYGLESAAVAQGAEHA